MPRPLIPVFLLDVVGIVGVLVAGFAHQRGNDRLMVGGIAVTVLCALLGALLLVRWARAKRAADPSDPGVIREL
ncbi:MAG: hypothetical protein JWO76_3397 [Nocardioides sp.]|nr:hypothetical protein [Nocardioides sp.]